MQLSITTNFPEVQRALGQLRQDIATKVTARAVNATIEQAKTQMSRSIRAEFNVNASFVRDRLRVKRATFRGGVLGVEATLFGSGKTRSANLIRFAARPGKLGVSFKVKKAGGRKTLPGTFIGNKGRTVFERVPGTKMASRKGGVKHSEKIKPMQTIDVPQMFTTRRINAAVVAAMRAKFPAIFQREMAFALSKFAGR